MSYYKRVDPRSFNRIDYVNTLCRCRWTVPDTKVNLVDTNQCCIYSIGAIQVSDFEDPTPREVGDLIKQVKAVKVPAIFGSEVFPSPVLEQIGRETGVRYYDTLRDDDPPGEPGSPENTYVGMLQFDVQQMAMALGGSSAPSDGLDPTNTYQP